MPTPLSLRQFLQLEGINPATGLRSHFSATELSRGIRGLLSGVETRVGWSAIISSDDVVAIHAALVPTNNGDGEILLFGGDNHFELAARAFQADHGNEVDHTRRFNCRNPNLPLIRVQSPGFDVFCCGHAFIGDGRLLIAGGTVRFPPESEGEHSHKHFAGHRHCAAYNPVSLVFENVVDMGFEPGHSSTGGGRWYPTLCTLANGEVFAFHGHPSDDDSRHDNDTPERYQPLTNNWVMLPAVGDGLQPDPTLFPRVHLLNDGNLFVSSAIVGFNENVRVNPFSGATQQVTPFPDDGGAYFSFSYPSVLLPLVPHDGYQARVLLCGGIRSHFIDLSDPNAQWVDVPRNGTTSNKDRVHSCATLLPTGDVLLTGGAIPHFDAQGNGLPDNDQVGVMEPELYRTPLDQRQGRYIPGVGRWDTINDPATVLRNYHSSALLMPDGRVWTAGGNAPGQPGDPPTVTQEKIEIYDPPYPTGLRPTISSCPSFIDYSDPFTVGVSNASAIGVAVLMRCGSSTHSFNPDQRAVLLNFDVTGVNTVVATAPPGGTVAPPGYYLLFVVDTDGRPCQYASFVRVGRSVESPRITVTTEPNELGGRLTITGDGFAPLGHVSIFADNLAGFPGPQELAFVSPDLNGHFSKVIDVRFHCVPLPQRDSVPIRAVDDITGSSVTDLTTAYICPQ